MRFSWFVGVSAVVACGLVLSVSSAQWRGPCGQPGFSVRVLQMLVNAFVVVPLHALALDLQPFVAFKCVPLELTISKRLRSARCVKSLEQFLWYSPDMPHVVHPVLDCCEAVAYLLLRKPQWAYKRWHDF